jgi:hypothetical protein
MQTSVDHFELLKQEVPSLEALSGAPNEIGYFAQEALRFFSIAGTLRENDMLKNASAAERQISHILGRSLLEGFYWLIYIFDDTAQRKDRYEQKLNAFKLQYHKLWNEPLIPDKSKLEPSDPSWAALSPGLDVNSMLGKCRNDYGNRLSYLYFVYRVSSFDTHGNSMTNLFESSFGKDCHFTVLNLEFGFDLIANQYLIILQELRDAREI